MAAAPNEFSSSPKVILIGHDSSDPDRSAVVLRAVACLLVILGVAILAIRWNDPLLGMHSFRQTQTAITSYWMLRGSPWLAYYTPVLGAPWSIPFEFPFYQGLVAVIVKLTGLPLDPVGRVVSYVFLLATIWPVKIICRALGLSDRDVYIFAVLFLASPIYLYWGTTFLIETMALFFSVAFLAAVMRLARTESFEQVAITALLGIMGALEKITTFIPFYIIAGAILLVYLGSRLKGSHSVRRSMISAVGAFAPAPMCFSFWNSFADAEKTQNNLGRYLMSSSSMMHRWNFGTWDQLFSERMLYTLIRGAADTCGLLVIGVLPILLVVCYRKQISQKRSVIAAVCLIGFVLPYAIFTNLHIIHNYYDVANAIFLVAAISTLVGGLISEQDSGIGWALLAVTVISQLAWFHSYFAKDLVHRHDYQMEIARVVEANTDDDSTIAIYGKDWSPVIPYYAHRRAIMEQAFAVHDEVMVRASNILAPQDGSPVEAVVYCPSAMDQDRALQQRLAPQLARLSRRNIGECQVYLVGRGNLERARSSSPDSISAR